MHELCSKEFERLKNNIHNEEFGAYVDTWDFEDEYSHNAIDEARYEFLEYANEYFEKENLPYIAKVGIGNVLIFDKKYGKRLSII